MFSVKHKEWLCDRVYVMSSVAAIATRLHVRLEEEMEVRHGKVSVSKCLIIRFSVSKKHTMESYNSIKCTLCSTTHVTENSRSHFFGIPICSPRPLLAHARHNSACKQVDLTT